MGLGFRVRRLDAKWGWMGLVHQPLVRSFEQGCVPGSEAVSPFFLEQRTRRSRSGGGRRGGNLKKKKKVGQEMLEPGARLEFYVGMVGLGPGHPP